MTVVVDDRMKRAADPAATQRHAHKTRGVLCVDRTDAVPLYHQIFLALRDDIMSGKRPFGASIPTEAELSATLHVSRITARRALYELAAHKLVERRRRVGTSVIFQSPTAPLEASTDQAVEALINFGRDTKMQVREIVREPARPEIASSLMLDPEALVVRAVRVRFLDGEPLGQVVSYVPGKLGKQITKAALASHTILQVLESGGHVIGDARQTIAAALADTALARTLKIEARAPILRIQRVVSDTAGKPVLAIIAEYRGDRYRIGFDLDGAARPEHA